MMTRREKLLLRPWQLRRYNNHKKKVLNAAPIVDFGPPPQRRHVTVKLKKLQNERERQMKIEEDNFTLLQHLWSIMTKKRVDNYWKRDRPTFLSRVGIYHRTRSPTPCEETSPITTPEITATRKSRCAACTPHSDVPVKIPEERIPWEPPKKILTRRQSGSAVVPVMSDFDFPQMKTPTTEVKVGSKALVPSTKDNQKLLEMKSAGKKKLVVSGKDSELPSLSSNKNLMKVEGAQQRIVLRQGPLQVAVNFPTFAEVKLVRGKSEKYLQRNFCDCKFLGKNTAHK